MVMCRYDTWYMDAHLYSSRDMQCNSLLSLLASQTSRSPHLLFPCLGLLGQPQAFLELSLFLSPSLLLLHNPYCVDWSASLFKEVDW